MGLNGSDVAREGKKSVRVIALSCTATLCFIVIEMQIRVLRVTTIHRTTPSRLKLGSEVAYYHYFTLSLPPSEDLYLHRLQPSFAFLHPTHPIMPHNTLTWLRKHSFIWHWHISPILLPVPLPLQLRISCCLMITSHPLSLGSWRADYYSLTWRSLSLTRYVAHHRHYCHHHHYHHHLLSPAAMWHHCSCQLGSVSVSVSVKWHFLATQ